MTEWPVLTGAILVLAILGAWVALGAIFGVVVGQEKRRATEADRILRDRYGERF